MMFLIFTIILTYRWEKCKMEMEKRGKFVENDINKFVE